MRKVLDKRMKRLGSPGEIPDITKGIVAAICSALLFGFSPVIAKLAYVGGSNGITMTFMRALFGLPVLILLARRQKIRLRLSREELPAVVLVSLFGAFATTILLYTSYSYINVGMATVLHYIFPVLVMLTNVLFFREKITWWKLLSLVLGFGGVLTFVGASRDSDMIGVVLALASVASYAFLMIGIERTAIKDMPAVRMSIYSHTTSLIGSFIIGTATGQLNFKLTPGAWVSSVAVALMVAVGAFTLLNYAIIKCGASTTAIIAMLEPLTGVLFGWLILKESLSPINLLGFLLIMSGVVLVSWYSGRKIPTKGDQEEGNGSKELQ